MQMYLVGGAVRDEILGVASKDHDFTVVLEDSDFAFPGIEDPFKVMAFKLASAGFDIFLETPQFFTIRARFPKGHENSRLTADFVLAREEGPYSDGRRPDWVKPGTLLMDQQRRDFTMNAIAKGKDGNLIDPFGGVEDIQRRMIHAVGDVRERFAEDALRAVRALRFSVTKGFTIAPEVKWEMQVQSVLDAIERLSDERIKDELEKMFRFDTVASLVALGEFPALTRAMLAGRVWLMPTMKER